MAEAEELDPLDAPYNELEQAVLDTARIIYCDSVAKRPFLEAEFEDWHEQNIRDARSAVSAASTLTAVFRAFVMKTRLKVIRMAEKDADQLIGLGEEDQSDMVGGTE